MAIAKHMGQVFVTNEVLFHMSVKVQVRNVCEVNTGTSLYVFAILKGRRRKVDRVKVDGVVGVVGNGRRLRNLLVIGKDGTNEQGDINLEMYCYCPNSTIW